MDDFRRIFYGVIIGFMVVIGLWVSFATFFACGSSLNCANGVPTAEHTAIPSLIAATLPPINEQVAAVATSGPAGTQAASSVPRPSNPGGPGTAVTLTGNVDSGKTLFAANCATCHGAEGKGGNPNPGSTDGTIPALNPIDPLLIDPDNSVFRTNVDLFVEHGSTPEGASPTFSMPAWGDKNLLTPQQIADVIAYVVSLNPAVPAAQGTGTTVAAGPTQSEPEPTEEVARPSNPGGQGQAVDLTGDPKSGEQIFTANCQICHNAAGKGGNPNPGSVDGTIPPLNPIDTTLKSPDYKTFAGNLDLFLEHGSTPEGPSPTFSMPAWGDKKQLTPQQIADVIAYVIGLNGGPSAQAPGATSAPAAPTAGTSVASGASPTAAEPEPTEEAAKPSNPGGPGQAVNLTGDANSGQQIFAANCQICHNTAGKGGNPNPGSVDGSIPALNPIDPTIKNPDHKTFATNMDLFIEHGSTPEGPGPTFSMPAWGDKNLLTPQQIADVIAYIIGLNP